MAETPCTDTDRTLLTRREIRKYFRVNERTISRWLERGLLIQVGEIPGQADSPTKVLFAVLDDGLIQKLQARLDNADRVELDADRLPPETRRELAEALLDKETLGALHDTAATSAARAERPSCGKPALVPSDPAITETTSRELATPGIESEEEVARGPQVIDADPEAGDSSLAESDDLTRETLLLQAELAEVQDLRPASLECVEARVSHLEKLIEDLIRRNLRAASVSTVSDNRTAPATASSVHEFGKKLATRRHSESHNTKVAPVVVLGAGILLLTWALALYLKTGVSLVALAGAVLANLAACATIVLGHKERS